MLEDTVLDRWWTEWLALFPGEPLWDPYGAGLVLAIALVILIWLLGLLRFWLFRQSRRPVDFGLDD
jgi:hypothetical protein